ncbi:MAG: glutamate-5-semialdehyde dehydrogenase, partial [Clostridia bacterium]|nr:glutamate-5-semialdehyde dehydrogenase [Clostridia bacterium]
MNVSEICKRAHDAQYALGAMSAEDKNGVLLAVARAIRESDDALIAANAIDIKLAEQSGMSKAMTDRLLLTKERIALMAEGVEQVANLPDPVGEVSDSWTLENGLHIDKVRAPLGVIGVIYEARPNVTADVFALCFKSGNCVVLRGGKEAINSNRAIYKVIADTLNRCGCDGDVIGFIDDASREGSAQLLKQGDTVDVIIPRGGDGLKKFVLDNAVMPVIASAGGVCHIYVERSADIDKSIYVI